MGKLANSLHRGRGGIFSPDDLKRRLKEAETDLKDRLKEVFNSKVGARLLQDLAQQRLEAAGPGAAAPADGSPPSSAAVIENIVYHETTI